MFSQSMWYILSGIHTDNTWAEAMFKKKTDALWEYFINVMIEVNGRFYVCLKSISSSYKHLLVKCASLVNITLW